jgi:hypothetical protein
MYHVSRGGWGGWGGGLLIQGCGGLLCINQGCWETCSDVHAHVSVYLFVYVGVAVCTGREGVLARCRLNKIQE